MSPNTEMSNELLLEARLVNNLNINNNNPSFGNRKSMNDANSTFKFINLIFSLDGDREVPITIISKIHKPSINAKLIVIQKYLRGYKAHKEAVELKSRAIKLEKVNSKDTSSSNTFDRATNQLDLLKLMQIHKEESKEDLLIEFNSHRDKSQRDKIEMVTTKNTLAIKEVRPDTTIK